MADKQIIFTTKKIAELKEKHDMGFKVARDEKFWFKNFLDVRRDGLTFSYTDEELVEYAKCKMGVDTEGEILTNPDFQTVDKTGIQYFAENYCKIKREDGSVGEIRLRDYQDGILDLYMNNRFSLLVGSRQIGKCLTPNTLVESTSSDGLSMYEIYYENKENMTFLDHLKLRIYRLVSYLKS